MLDARFSDRARRGHRPVRPDAAEAAAAPATSRRAMDAVRRVHREQTFRIGVQMLTGRTAAGGRGPRLRRPRRRRASAPWRPPPWPRRCVWAAPSRRRGGGGRARQGRLARDDRQLRPRPDDRLRRRRPRPCPTARAGRADVFYGRFTQRLIAALSAPTAEGGLYEVDMQLRPGAAKGPVSVRLSAVRGLLRRRGRDLGVHGPDPRPGGLGRRSGLRRAGDRGDRGDPAPAPRRAWTSPPTPAGCAT